jgi:hypothetical protein
MKRRFFLFLGIGTSMLIPTHFFLKEKYRGYNLSNIRKRINLYLPPPSNKQIIDELRDEFEYLDIAEDVAMKFILDYKKVYNKKIRFPLSTDLKKIFLLSTDFIHNAGLEKKVSYMVLYSPFDSPCYNPFMVRTYI